jgi:sugar phosphate permease
MLNRTHASQRGTIWGLVSISNNVGQGVSTVCMGFLGERFG